MVNSIILLIMCIARVVLLSIPAIVVIIITLIILNKIFGIRVLKNIEKLMMKGVR